VQNAEEVKIYFRQFVQNGQRRERVNREAHMTPSERRLVKLSNFLTK
jgi:hypothetical protein